MCVCVCVCVCICVQVPLVAKEVGTASIKILCDFHFSIARLSLVICILRLIRYDPEMWWRSFLSGEEVVRNLLNSG